MQIKKRFKKICCIFIAGALLGTNAATGFAQSAASLDNAVFEVSSLGIFTGDENGELHLDDNMTRAEFAKITTAITGNELAAEAFGGRGEFSDVPENHWAAKYIDCCFGLGYMTGDGNGKFRPDDTVTLDECVKTVVAAMGYEPAAQMAGGYPSGYYSVAADKHILTNIKGTGNEPAVRRDILFLIYNALDVPHMVDDYSGQGRYEIDDDTTIRSLIEDSKDLKAVTGIVTANSQMWLDKEQSGMNTDQIELDGEIYDVDENVVKIASELIGQEVVAYYRDDEKNGERTVYNIQPTTENTVTRINAEDLDEFTDTEIQYSDESGKSHKIKLNDATRYTYNNRPETRFLSLFGDIENGFITVIDNDGDNKTDFVFVSEYKSYVIEKANKNGNLKLKYMGYSSGDPYVSYINVLLDEDKDNAFIIENSDGTELTYADLKEDDVISLFENNYDTFIKVVKSDEEVLRNSVSGKSSDDTVKIGDNEYDVEYEALYEWLKTGDVYDFYINAYGKIVYAASADDSDAEKNTWKYGYIYRAYNGDSDEKEVKMINAGSVINREETNLEDRTDTETVPVTICQNDSIVSLKVANTVNTDSGSCKSADIDKYVGMPVKYTLNASGELKKIQLLEKAGGSETTIYNSKEKVFGTANVVYGTPFMINEKTKVVCIPDNGSTDNSDLLVRLSLDNKDESIRYNAIGYDTDDDTKAVKLFVITKEMKADSISPVIPKQAKLGVIQDVVLSINEDGEECENVTMMVGTELKQSKTLPVQDRPALEALKKGDVVFFSEDADDKIENALTVNNVYSALKGEAGTNRSDVTEIMGYVQDVRLNEISNRERIKINQLDVVTADGLETVDVPVRNYPDVFIYNLKSDVVESGSIDDIVPYPYELKDSDHILIVKSGTTIRGIVVIR